MFNTCYNCGMYRVDKVVIPEGPYAVCPECGYRHPFRWLPLLIVSGASGVGKSTVCRALVGKMTQVVLLDSDILWRAEFNRPEKNYRDYFELWLRVCKNIAQSGRPVVLFGAGAGVPENIEPCLERRYFSGVCYLALTCSPEVQAARLRQRPSWRNSADPEYIDRHIQFNRWFVENAQKVTPPIDLLDTTVSTVEETCDRLAQWIRARSGR